MSTSNFESPNGPIEIRAKTLESSDLIFPSASVSVSKALASISRSSLTIANRLRSIALDAAFIRHCATVLDVPLISNERCGGWYVEPELKAGSTYFKSTDGHYGQWRFSLRRLNLGVLDLASEAGCMVVDSTRRGKHLPDALSKTIPIWCAVFNRLLFPELPHSHRFVHLPELISASEAAQIEARIPCCVEEARKLDLDLATLRAKLSSPLKPFWVARGLGLLPENVNSPRETGVTPVYLAMASEHHGSRSAGVDGYVQGAGDDVENWSADLTPSVYWDNQDQLLMASEEDLPEVIALLAGKYQAQSCEPQYTAVAHAPWLELGMYSGRIDTSDPARLSLLCSSSPLENVSQVATSRVIHLKCGDGKLGSRLLRTELEKVATLLEMRGSSFQHVRVYAESTKDIGVGAALAVLCLLSDVNGNLDATARAKQAIDKDMIRKKLSWILTSLPSASPSRATLNSVNAFLMKPAR